MTDPGKQPQIVDSVLPVVAEGRQEVATSQHELCDVVKLISTRGHTIDHFSVHIGNAGADAVIGGDMILSPIQARRPKLATLGDYDRARVASLAGRCSASCATRRRCCVLGTFHRHRRGC